MTMNISQIRTFARRAFEIGQRSGRRPADAPRIAMDFRQDLVDLDDLATKPIEWQEAERIRDVDTVDEAFRDFVDDPTTDAATILVQVVIKAYLKG